MDRTRKLLLALAAAAVAATLLALRGWIAPATARWVLLALVWGSLLLFIVVSALAGYLTIIRYNHKLKKSQQ